MLQAAEFAVTIAKVPVHAPPARHMVRVVSVRDRETSQHPKLRFDQIEPRRFGWRPHRLDAKPPQQGEECRMVVDVAQFRGEYGRAVELATSNLAALPTEWIYEYFGANAPPSVNDRCWLVVSLAQLGRFAEAAEHVAEAIRLAEPTQHATTVGLTYRAAGMLHLIKGDWAQARSLSEHGFAVFKTGNVAIQLPSALAASAWALAQLGEANEALNQIGLAEQVIARFATTGIVGHLAWSYQALGRAALRLGRLDEARRLADRAVEFSPRHPGFAAYAMHLLGDIATHPERFDADSGMARYREALTLAEPRGMRPVVAHCHLGLGVLCGRIDKRDRAREHFTTARKMYREMDMRFWLERVRAESKALT
jgi:tetratricopeptide (TPR) repeat protein